MAYNFPDAPTPGTVFNQWTWNGTAWVLTTPIILLAAGGQTTTGGYKFTVVEKGNVAGTTFTPDAFLGNYQRVINNGAFTFAAPTSDCALDVMVTNTASAGAITFTGYTTGANKGDNLSTTNGHIFIISVRRMSGVSTYVVKALQ